MKISAQESEQRAGLLLGLSKADVVARRQWVGASDANMILSGDDDKIYKLWQVKRGEADPDDLSGVLPVQMGTWTEALNVRWFELQTGCKITERDAKYTHKAVPYILARLDGSTTLPDGRRAVFEAKHVGPFNYDLQTIVERYMPQLAVQMAVTDWECAALSVFSGNSRWEYTVIERDPLYEATVISAIKQFWQHVQDGTPPVDLPSPAIPMPNVMMRSVDMATNNAWCSMEIDYLAHEEASKLFASAKDGMKKLVDEDVREAKGRQLAIKRGKTGSLTFSKVRTK